MVTELIPLIVGKEQDIELIYDSVRYQFELRYDDYNGYWFIKNITNTVDDAVVISGLRILLNNDVFSNLAYLGFYNMKLIDTDPSSDTELNMFSDFGDRLKLYRQIPE